MKHIITISKLKYSNENGINKKSAPPQMELAQWNTMHHEKRSKAKQKWVCVWHKIYSKRNFKFLFILMHF